MTGAQERAFERLKRKHRADVVTRPRDGEDLVVAWASKDAFGEPKRVVANVTPEGRVIEQT